MNSIAHYRGALLGLATGDAVGTTLEFTPPDSVIPIQDMVGGGPFHLQPGQWTDDTSMALCLAESLIECRGFDPVDQLQRYVRWWRTGHLSSTGTCFDIGTTVREALTTFERTGRPDSGVTHDRSAGNGSIMRLAPVPLFFARDPATAIRRSGDSSRTTHGVQAAVDACRYLGALLVGAVQGTPKEELLGPRYSPVPGLWEADPLTHAIDAIAAGSFKERYPPDIQGSGYVVRSLEAALWAFYQTSTFRAGCLLAANLGDDADTTAAVYGQLAGASYGDEGIPAEWLARLAQRDLITRYAEQLHALAEAV